MTFDMLYSKIHRATVSDANLNYVGSITIDEELMQAAALRVGQKVDIGLHCFIFYMNFCKNQ